VFEESGAIRPDEVESEVARLGRTLGTNLTLDLRTTGA
jgi:hypothetical protein